MAKRYVSYLFLILLLACGSYGYAHTKLATLVSTSSHCAVTPFVKDNPPRPAPAPGEWFSNEDRTIWVSFGGWDFVRRGPFKPDPQTGYRPGRKVMWFKPPYPLVVTGRRTDGAAPPLVYDISRDPRPRGTLQISGIYFPAAGCWDVNATAGPSKLHFVVLVKNPPS